MRYFNTEGPCEPEVHYMVKLDDRLAQIKRYFIDQGKYFVMNRGRQYGKTTTLCALEEYLKRDYLVVFLDFQGITTAEYQDETVFTGAFIRMFVEAIEENELLEDEREPIVELLKKFERNTLSGMFSLLSEICKVASKPVVMMIDEVDSAGNNQVFIDFLALLRGYYIKRKKKPIFHSVILAGVYDIKNLKLKLRPNDEHQYNSPWNIAADFDLKMEFTIEQIEVMLQEYESDRHTGMNVSEIARELYRYTSGYPYLISAICKIMDEKLSIYGDIATVGNVWSREGITEAVKVMLKSKVPLFDSMIKQLDAYENLRRLVEEILYQGKRIPFSPAEKSINLGLMFGFFKEQEGHVAIANRIFEMYLLNLFMAEESVQSEMFLYGQSNKNQFITGKYLNMDLVLEKFVSHFTDVYSENDERFIETYGRKLFLLYLKPIINGVGNYYIEAQTLDARRTDVIVDYRGEQFIIELKIWHGNEYNERGEKQLIEYLEYFHQKKGYLISFNFNKKKETGVKVIKLGDYVIVEAVV